MRTITKDPRRTSEHRGAGSSRRGCAGCPDLSELIAKAVEVIGYGTVISDDELRAATTAAAPDLAEHWGCVTAALEKRAAQGRFIHASGLWATWPRPATRSAPRPLHLARLYRRITAGRISDPAAAIEEVLRAVDDHEEYLRRQAYDQGATDARTQALAEASSRIVADLTTAGHHQAAAIVAHLTPEIAAMPAAPCSSRRSMRPRTTAVAAVGA